jgi:hypothetical protein
LPATAVVACAVAALGIGLSGCAGGSAVSSAIDPVAKAAQASELAPGFKASLSEEVNVPGSAQTVTASGTEVFDEHTHRGVFSVDSSAGGHSVHVESQYSPLVLYLRLPSSTQESSVTHGKPWIKLDLRGVGTALGISFSALSSPAGSSDPSQLLSYLKATSGRITRIGTEQVQGVSTTHYRGTIDYDHYAESVAPAKRAAAKQSIAALERLTGTHGQAVDVWVDGQQRVRREEMTSHECIPGTSGASRMHLKVEFSDFGEQVIPPAPSSREVADLTSYVVEKLKHVKLGCQ